MAKQYTDQVLEQIALALDERQHPRTTESSIPLLAGIQTSSSSTFSLLSAAGAKDGSIPTAKSAFSSSRAGGIGSSSSGGGPGPDSVDDPRQILRALSRLSL